MIIYPPCKGCNERYIGCHSQCEQYKAYKDKVDEQAKAQNKAKHKVYIGDIRNGEWKLRTSQSNREKE